MSEEIKNKIAPTLRFPEFKETEEWKIMPLKEVYVFKSTNSFTRDDLNYIEGEIKNIHYGDIHAKFSTQFDITNEKVPFIKSSIPTEKIGIENYCIEGDMIFADASEDLKDVGKSIELVSLNNEKLLSGLHTLLARQRDHKLVVGFGGHLFLCNSIRSQIKREAQGAKVLGISATRLSNINIFYPSKPDEQQKIADCLSSLDDLITTQKQKLEALKTHKKGLMQQLFPAEGEMVPQLRFAEFRESGNWEEKKLGDIGKFTGGGTPIRINEDFWRGDIPWISSSDLQDDSIKAIKINRFITESALQQSATKLVPKNSILLVSRVGVGKLAISRNAICTSQDFTNFTPANDDLVFLAYYLKLISNVLLSFSQGMAIMGFTKDDISRLELMLPTLQEQQKIANCLSSLDDLITAQKEKIEALKVHKKGLMQQLFPNINE